MRLKIKKNVLGEEYGFFITLQMKSFDCTYSIHFKDGEQFPARVTEDFNHIILGTPIVLDGYANHLNPPKKTINKIKIPKHRRRDIIEQITGVY